MSSYHQTSARQDLEKKMEGDMKSAVWTARNQAESLSHRRDDYRIQFGKKPQETAKFII